MNDAIGTARQHLHTEALREVFDRGPSSAAPSVQAPPDFADFDTERAVLAAVLAEPDSLNTVTGIFRRLQSRRRARKARKKFNVEEGDNSYFRKIARNHVPQSETRTDSTERCFRFNRN